MQDIEALCDRVMVINHGRLGHDGPLSDIVDRFAGYKIVTLRFHVGRMPERLEDMGEIVEVNPPKVTLRLPREAVASRAAALLAAYEIDDFSVEDPPIEDVIAEMFKATAAENQPEQEATHA